MTKRRTFLAITAALLLLLTTVYFAGGDDTSSSAPTVQVGDIGAIGVAEDLPPRASRSRQIPVPPVVRHPQPVHKPVHKVVHRPVTTRRPASLHRSVGGQVYDITMYCPTGNRTASGKVPQRGMVATISRAIPFGTVVHIEGLGNYTVEDRIGHGSDFDLFTPSCSEANTFGRQHHRVTW